MVQIKIKGINKEYHVVITFDDFEECIQQLQERLKACYRGDNRFFEAFFHICELNSEQLLRFFQVCKEVNTYVLGINYVYVEEKKQMKMLELDLYNGQTYTFAEPTLLVGNISPQAYVTCKDALYVIGHVRGSIDFLYEDCFLCASSVDANVRICDTNFQNVTIFAPSKVYYEHRHLEMKEFKEERMWQKQ